MKNFYLLTGCLLYALHNYGAADSEPRLIGIACKTPMYVVKQGSLDNKYRCILAYTTNLSFFQGRLRDITNELFEQSARIHSFDEYKKMMEQALHKNVQPLEVGSTLLLLLVLEKKEWLCHAAHRRNYPDQLGGGSTSYTIPLGKKHQILTANSSLGILLPAKLRYPGCVVEPHNLDVAARHTLDRSTRVSDDIAVVFDQKICEDAKYGCFIQ